MTEQEIKQFNPTYENRLTTVCDDGYFVEEYKIISIISPVHKGKVIFLDRHDNLVIFDKENLVHYPSLRPEEPKFKKVVRYVPVFYEGDFGLSKSFETIDECMEQEMSYSKMPAIGYKPVTVYLKKDEE